MLRPNAEFWRLWARALACLALTTGLLLWHPLARAGTMRASFYDQGHRTASGVPFRPMGFSAAHRMLPFGTHLRVCLIGCVTVTVLDRGPFARGRSLDLSRGAARAIGLETRGVASVSVDRLD